MSDSKITRIISPKVFGQIKEKARKLKRSQNIKLHQAQEIVAKEINFDNWNQIAQAHKIAELFYNSFYKGLAIGLSRDGFYDQEFSEECQKFYTEDNLSVIYQSGKEDIRNFHPKYELDDDGKKDYFTDEDLDDIIFTAEMEVVFYAFNGKVDLNNKMASIYSVIDCLDGETPKYMWFNGEYIDMNSLEENDEEVKLRCSQIYNTYRHMPIGDEEIVLIHPEYPNPYRDLDNIKLLEKQGKVEILSEDKNSHVSFKKIKDTNTKKSTRPSYPSLKKALIASESLNTPKRSIVGVAHNPSDKYSPFQFFEVVYDKDENWYSVHFNGGFFWEDGSSGEEESYGNESVDDLIAEVKATFPHINNVVFFELPWMDLERYAEVLVYKIFPDLPPADEYWPDNKLAYETLCIERINKANAKALG